MTWIGICDNREGITYSPSLPSQRLSQCLERMIRFSQVQRFPLLGLRLNTDILPAFHGIRRCIPVRTMSPHTVICQSLEDGHRRWHRFTGSQTLMKESEEGQAVCDLPDLSAYQVTEWTIAYESGMHQIRSLGKAFAPGRFKAGVGG